VLALGGEGVEITDSPILGAEGNREFLLYASFMKRRMPEAPR
jgi:predicted rRNA methylase YqxC with S4 and FtsJ domains